MQHFDIAGGGERQSAAPPSSALDDTENEQPSSAADGESLGGVAAQWVASVAKASVSLCTTVSNARSTDPLLLADIQRILELKELSAAGAKQLATDISYLCNFLTGLSIPHDPALVRLLELLPLSPAECVSLALRWPLSPDLVSRRLKEVPRSTDDRLQTITESFVAIRSAKPAPANTTATLK